MASWWIIFIRMHGIIVLENLPAITQSQNVIRGYAGGAWSTRRVVSVNPQTDEKIFPSVHGVPRNLILSQL